MSEEFTREEKLDASRLLLSGFVAEIIGGGSIFLIVLIIGLLDPFFAAFLIIIIAASATLGCGLIMIWLGNPYNIYWKKAKGIYTDVGDGDLNEDPNIIEVKQGVKTRVNGNLMDKHEIDRGYQRTFQ